MTYPLAIFAPTIGDCSETFIRRHMEDLFPGGTVVMTDTICDNYWSVKCPLLVLGEIEQVGLKRQIIYAIGRKLGVQGRGQQAAARRFLKAHQVRVVMGEWLDGSLPWLGVARELGIKFFGHAHGYDISLKLRDPRWRAAYLGYNQADGIITMSQASRDRLVGLGLDSSKIHVVPYGIDVPLRPTIRAKQDVIRCVAVGRMVAKKAPILALDAFRRAAEACPTLRLDYVGDGPLLSAAYQYVLAFNLHDRVTLYRSQPNEVVHDLMKTADIFLQHSMTDPETGDEEGFPVAILEAMANALPVVSTRHAGIPEQVVEGSTGFLVDEGDSVGMADRIIKLAHNPDLRRCMGQAGWSRVKDHFSWEKEKTELLRILGVGR